MSQNYHEKYHKDSFISYVRKIFRKLTFLTPWYGHVRTYVLNEWSPSHNILKLCKKGWITLGLGFSSSKNSSWKSGHKWYFFKVYSANTRISYTVVVLLPLLPTLIRYLPTRDARRKVAYRLHWVTGLAKDIQTPPSEKLLFLLSVFFLQSYRKSEITEWLFFFSFLSH